MNYAWSGICVILSFGFFSDSFESDSFFNKLQFKGYLIFSYQVNLFTLNVFANFIIPLSISKLQIVTTGMIRYTYIY